MADGLTRRSADRREGPVVAAAQSDVWIVRACSKDPPGRLLLLDVHQPFHEEPLHQHDHQHRRQSRQHGDRHDQMIERLIVGRRHQALDGDEHGREARVRRHQQRPEVLIPAVDEEDHEQCGNIGARHRQQHVPEEIHGTGAVDEGCFRQFLGHRQEELAEKKCRGRAGDQRHRQAGPGVKQIEPGDDLVGRQDAHLDGQHQGHEDDEEGEACGRESGSRRRRRPTAARSGFFPRR